MSRSRPRSQRYYCRTCLARNGGMWHRERGLVCVFCHAPFGPKQPTPRRVDEAIVRRKSRAMARHDEPAPTDAYATAHPGHPLGKGMPLGETMRVDGESHLEAWARVLRNDACSYCDSRLSGTVDHIEPRSLRRPGLHNWTNFTAACESCNGSKDSRPLLLFLAYRGIKLRDDRPQRQPQAQQGGR